MKKGKETEKEREQREKRQMYQKKYMKILQDSCENIKEEDLLYKGYLKPIEIHLKASQTPVSSGSNQFPQRFLPIGLQVAYKDSITNNRYDLQNIQQIKGKATLKEIRSLYQDNLLTLMKDGNEIELAICVCMCNEDKRMLKTTLAGIEENISQIVTREKISSDKIGVFVMMDGIDKVDQSCFQYFEEMENYSGISLVQNIAPDFTAEEMIIRAREKSPQELCKEQLKNINNFLFDPIERVDINERRFMNVKKEYDEITKLKAEIQKLKEKEKANKKINFHDLPGKLKQFFIAQALQQEKVDQSKQTEKQQQAKENDPEKDKQLGQMPEVKKMEKYYKKQLEKQRKSREEYLVSKYTQDPHKAKSMFLKALSEGEIYCNDYINSRQNLAYLACFRKKIRHSLNKLPPKQKKSNDDSKTNFNEQIDEPSHSTTMNLFLCVKYKNGGKLSSHNWFFNGFCKELKPKYAVLLDVGLKPDIKALLKMYRHLKNNNKVGGVCGYMSLKIEQIDDKDQIKDEDIDFFTKFWLNFVDIQRTQQVEYHFAHLIDKPFQAAFGFIHVLPGAFSAYNMHTILNYDEEQDQLMKSYFKSINGSQKNDKNVPTNLSIKEILLRTLLPNFINSCFIDVDPNSEQQMLYNENIYLAEDRILCMGIHKKQMDIDYLPEVRATVDPMKFVIALLGQRKRWINGSLFAFQKVTVEMKQFWKTTKMQILLRFQMFYLTLMNSFSFFAPSFFLFSIHIAMQAFRVDVLPNLLGGVVPDPNNNQLFKGFVYTIDFIYVLLVMSAILFSLLMKNDKKQFKSCMYLITTLLGMFAIIVFIVLMVDVIRGFLNSSAYLIQNKEMTGDIPGGITTIDAMRWMLIGTTGVYALPVLFHVFLFKRLSILCQIIQGAFSFLFYGPTYLIILYIYSICRIDDISWGTKGLNSDKSDDNKQMKDSWRVIKFLHVSKYIFWNLILSVVLLSFGSSYTPRFFITIIVVAAMALLQSIKVIIAISYLIWYKLKNFQFCKQPRVFCLHESSSINDHIVIYKNQMIEEIISRLLDIIIEFEQNLKNKINGESLFEIARSYRQIIKSQAKISKKRQMKNAVALSTIEQKIHQIPSVILRRKKKQNNLESRPKQQQQKPKNKRRQPYMEQESQRILTHRDYQKQQIDDRNYRTSYNAEFQEDQITIALEANKYRDDQQ